MEVCTKSADILNGLLRGEIAAVETYKRAISTIQGSEGAGVKTLRNIEYNHESANAELRTKITGSGGRPAKNCDAWGVFLAAIEGSPKLFDNAAALRALKEGEENGVREYELALANVDLFPECHRMIRDRLLPQTRTHVRQLDLLLAAC